LTRRLVIHNIPLNAPANLTLMHYYVRWGRTQGKHSF
jgi:hypothetical protein